MFGTEGDSGPMQIDRDFRRGETWTSGPHRHPSFDTIGYISLGKSGRKSDAWHLPLAPALIRREPPSRR